MFYKNRLSWKEDGKEDTHYVPCNGSLNIYNFQVISEREIISGPNEQPAREVGERERRSSRSHHVWGARLGRGRKEERFREPSDLAHLEHLARRSVLLMERHTPASPNNFHKAMDLLRQQYNMNFIMICGQCHGPHVYDEITAPER